MPELTAVSPSRQPPSRSASPRLRNPPTPPPALSCSQRAFIRGAINLPAHSFFPTLPSLLPLLRTYKRVIFHCQSSSGRGPRCAGWLQDALDALPASDEGAKPDVVVLKGGIKEWYRLYGGEEEVTVRIAGEGWSD